VRRLGPTLLVIALLAATIAAFALAERLKLEPSPIAGTRVFNKVFSPVCDCPKEAARIRFDLREPGRVVAVVVDADDEVVRTLADRRHGAGRVWLRWDGRGDAGRLVAEGTYRPRVRLPDDKRTFSLPNPIRVDTTPPRLTAAVHPLAFSPDGDGRNDGIVARYRLSERAHGLLLVDGRREVRTRYQRPQGAMRWFGLRDGRPMPTGRYSVAVGAEDEAGNQASPVETVVSIRYIELGRELVRVRGGTRFSVRVTTDASSFRWRFAGGAGTAEPGRLVLRAPRRPRRYELFVVANGHGASALVVVSRRPPAP
jgi:FlgD Ig-like domain